MMPGDRDDPQERVGHRGLQCLLRGYGHGRAGARRSRSRRRGTVGVGGAARVTGGLVAGGVRNAGEPARRQARVYAWRHRAGQTGTGRRICTGHVSGPAARPRAARRRSPILPARGPTLRARVSLRDRRDARPHPRSSSSSSRLRRPAVPGAAAVDGADPGAGAVRAGGQADAPLRRVQARRHRRVQPARRRGRATARRSSSGSSASRATRSRSGTTGSSTSTAPRSTSRTRTRTTRASASRPRHAPTRAAGSCPTGELFLHGRPPPAAPPTRGCSARPDRQRDRPRVAALLADRHVRASCRPRPTPTSQPASS